MATNTYTYGALGQRWTVGDPTSKANLDISRVKNDSLRWTVTQLLGDPDDDSGWNLDSFITPPPNVGGADTQIQFNNGGVFGGSANLVWTGTNLEVTGVADITAPTSSVGLSVDSTTGNVELQTDGQVYGYQKLDVATAGLQIKSYSDGGAAKTEQARLYMGQSTTSAAGGYFSFYTNNGTAIAERVLFDKDGNVTINSGNLSAASGTVTAEGVITDAPTTGTPLDITGDGGQAGTNWLSVSHGGSVRAGGYVANTYWGIASDNALNGPGIFADLSNNTMQLMSGSSGLAALIANADRSVYPVGGLATNSILLDGVTATTQSASDNSTKVATTAYADAAAAAVAGPAAGSNTQVQYNNSGAFGASSNLTFDGTSLTAALSATSSLASGVTATTQAASDNSTKVATTAYADAAAAAVSRPPGGATTQVQYNSGGSFAGSANLTFDGTNLTAALSATSTLASGVTATTQTAGDNSTKVATTAYADAAASTAASGVTTYPSSGALGTIQFSNGASVFNGSGEFSYEPKISTAQPVLKVGNTHDAASSATSIRVRDARGWIDTAGIAIGEDQLADTGNNGIRNGYVGIQITAPRGNDNPTVGNLTSGYDHVIDFVTYNAEDWETLGGNFDNYNADAARISFVNDGEYGGGVFEIQTGWNTGIDNHVQSSLGDAAGGRALPDGNYMKQFLQWSWGGWSFFSAEPWVFLADDVRKVQHYYNTNGDYKKYWHDGFDKFGWLFDVNFFYNWDVDGSGSIGGYDRWGYTNWSLGCWLEDDSADLRLHYTTTYNNPTSANLKDTFAHLSVRQQVYNSYNGLWLSTLNAPLHNDLFGETKDSFFRVRYEHLTNDLIRAESTGATYTGNVVNITTEKNSASDFNMLLATVNKTVSANDIFKLRGDGNAYAEVAWNGGGADYQEFFESSTGVAHENGRAVVLVDDCVRYYDESIDSVDDIIGVTRPKINNRNAAITGNSAWDGWQEKYLTDDFGVFVMEEVSGWQWERIEPVAPEGELDIRPTLYYTQEDADNGKIPPNKNIGDRKRKGLKKTKNEAEDRTIINAGEMLDRDAPEGYTPPAHATRFTRMDRAYNPQYDPNREYVSREYRDEWWLIGLLGQIQVKKGEPVNPRWIKMGDISNSVERWLVR